MPTYVYKCDSCGAQFEQFQSFKDEPIRTCPSCAGAVRRVFQPVGIVFKGSGWYITDSRKSSSATVGTSDDASKTDSAKGGEAKTEAKAEAPASASPASDSAASTSASSSTTA
ncbi:zinc ribbon domain-containing protein [Chloroflexia bacterium SDU3-3]|nr:zinc ribbon domain-containing protein [Chloroflexia bacterium SDU3-3]